MQVLIVCRIRAFRLCLEEAVQTPHEDISISLTIPNETSPLATGESTPRIRAGRLMRRM
jgi:hypothetical protein